MRADRYSLDADAARRVGRATLRSERLTRQGDNLTPAAAVGPARGADEVWSVEVTGATSPGSGLADGKLRYLDTTATPVAWADVPDGACYVVPRPGGTLAVGDEGAARLEGEKDGRAVYSLAAGGSGGGGTGNGCVGGCGWVRGSRTGDCFSLTQTYPTDGVTVPAPIALYWDGDGTTGTAEPGTDPDTGDPLTFTVCGVEYSVRFYVDADGDPALEFTSSGGSGGDVTYRLSLDCCYTNGAYFTLPGAPNCLDPRPDGGPGAGAVGFDLRWNGDACSVVLTDCCGDDEMPAVLWVTAEVDPGVPTPPFVNASAYAGTYRVVYDEGLDAWVGEDLSSDPDIYWRWIVSCSGPPEGWEARLQSTYLGPGGGESVTVSGVMDETGEGTCDRPILLFADLTTTGSGNANLDITVSETPP